MYFPRYVAYGFGVPLIIVIFCIAIDSSGFIPSFAIGYGEAGCWIGHRLASFIFLFLPMLYVASSNIILYLLTISSINYVSSITNSVTHRDRGRSDLFIYLRIFAVLGITWIFGILVLFTPDGSTIEKVLILCFVITDSLQGFFLFWVFTFNRRVLEMYKRMFAKLRENYQLHREVEARMKSKAKLIKQQIIEEKG